MASCVCDSLLSTPIGQTYRVYRNKSASDQKGRLCKVAEVQLLNNLVKSPQLVTGRSSRNKQAALSILPVNKQPLSPAMPGTGSAVKPSVTMLVLSVTNWLE